jgi:hypothetical protein
MAFSMKAGLPCLAKSSSKPISSSPCLYARHNACVLRAVVRAP